MRICKVADADCSWLCMAVNWSTDWHLLVLCVVSMPHNALSVALPHQVNMALHHSWQQKQQNHIESHVGRGSVVDAN